MRSSEWRDCSLGTPHSLALFLLSLLIACPVWPVSNSLRERGEFQFPFLQRFLGALASYTFRHLASLTPDGSTMPSPARDQYHPSAPASSLHEAVITFVPLPPLPLPAASHCHIHSMAEAIFGTFFARLASHLALPLPLSHPPSHTVHHRPPICARSFAAAVVPHTTNDAPVVRQFTWR